MPNPALETLLLAFTGEGALAIPSRALFLGAEPHPALTDWPEIHGWQPHKPTADAWTRAGFPRSDSPEARWPLVLQLPGKSRDEVLAGFSRAWDLLAPGGTLVAAMENGTGAKRFERTLADAVGGVESIQKNKCRVFAARKDASHPAVLPEEWREAGRRHAIPATDFVTEAGIFSSGRIDPGSLLLAEVLSDTMKGKVADLGAGWGYLADAVLRRCPAVEQVDLYEADARALDCARVNLEGHARALKFHWFDVTPGLPKRYDAIVMNPPFHSGRSSDVGLGQAFLKAAAAALNPGGELWLVANRQLPYEAVLDACGLRRTPIGGDATYKLIRAVR
jgi:16S rRNA (guanine1207-N2)-methyltransferase